MAEIVGLPRRFGRYTLVDFVGKGGMAEIFLAEAETDLGGARTCVVKEILPHLANESKFADMLIFEAKLAAQLSHANIVQVFDLGRTEDRLFIAMEYVEGYDLNALLRECTRRAVPLPLEFALEIIHSILRGLDYAHRREDEGGKRLGIVHRDVSPSNILVSFSGEVKVCDFGIAHANSLVEKPWGLTQEAIQGKAGYMSPEHASGGSVDARSDVFASGILLWELLSGRRLYKAGDGATLLDRAREANIPDPPPRGYAGEAALMDLLRKALQRNPEDRFQSAAEMAEALDGFCSDYKVQRSAIQFGEWLRTHLRKREGDTAAEAPMKTAEPDAFSAPAMSVSASELDVISAPAMSVSAPDVSAPDVSAPAMSVSGSELEEIDTSSGETHTGAPNSSQRVRRAPLVGAMIPSPGAMRTFKELAKTADADLLPEVSVASGPAKLNMRWILVLAVVCAALLYILFRV